MTSYNTLKVWSASETLGSSDLNSNCANLDFLKTQVNKNICQGRLTLETGVPISTTDQTAKTTVYFAPYLGSLIALYDGTSSWDLYTFSELSLSVSGYTASSVYDIFCYLSSGNPTLESLVWTNTTTRATALTLDGGNWVKSGDATRRYLGSIYVLSSVQCVDSAAQRYVWNCHNRVARPLLCKDTTNSWTYSTATFRSANNNTTYGTARVGVVIGLSEDPVVLTYQSHAQNDYAAYVQDTVVGIGAESTSTNSAQVYGCQGGYGGNVVPIARYYGFPGIGVRFFQALEYAEATGTTTWFGDNGGTFQTGMLGHVMA